MESTSESPKFIETPYARRNYTLRVVPNLGLSLPGRDLEKVCTLLGELLTLLFEKTDLMPRLTGGSLQVRLGSGWVSGGVEDLKLQIGLILNSSPSCGIRLLNHYLK